MACTLHTLFVRSARLLFTTTTGTETSEHGVTARAVFTLTVVLTDTDIDLWEAVSAVGACCAASTALNTERATTERVTEAGKAFVADTASFTGRTSRTSRHTAGTEATGFAFGVFDAAEASFTGQIGSAGLSCITTAGTLACAIVTLETAFALAVRVTGSATDIVFGQTLLDASSDLFTGEIRRTEVIGVAGLEATTTASVDALAEAIFAAFTVLRTRLA